MKNCCAEWKTLLLVFFFLSLASVGWSQTIAYWNFNDGPSDNTVNWPATVPADLGSASLTHNFANVVSFGGTGINGLEGEVSGGSFCPQGGAANENNGRWFQIEVPELASGSLILSYAGRRTGTGFTSHRIEYSTDGGSNWTLSQTIDVSGWANSWVANQLVEVALSDLPGMYNNPDFLLRIVVDGATSSSGNNRFDNLHLEAGDGFLSTEARLDSWEMGGLDVLSLPGINVADPLNDAGAVLEVDDFAGFYGTALQPKSTTTQIELLLNGQVLDALEWPGYQWTDGDQLELTVNAEDPRYQQFYKLRLQQASFVTGLDVSGSLYPFRQVEVGSVSDVQFYYLSAGGLAEPVVVEAPEGFLLSFDCDVNFGPSLQINESDFNNRRIYVRFAPTEVKAYSGQIVHNVGNTETQTLVSGSGIASRIPEGYYNGTTGQGQELMAQLHQLINGHTVFTYSEIWNNFGDADLKFNGKIWDIYGTLECTEAPYEYTLGTDQDSGTNVDEEGRFYNREHSWPVSWWGGSQSDTMYTDVHHIFPSDKLVNAQRGNQSFGEVDVPQWTSLNGSLLGPNVAGSTFSALVFEPHDAYKGDLARAWMYMVTRYMHRTPSWSNQNLIPDILDGTSWPSFEPWVVELLLKWHAQDPVGQKERHRNQQIYLLQGNRNPYIDHPEWAPLVFGQTTSLSPQSASLLKVHPNPLQDWLYLSVDRSLPVRVEVFDSMGRPIITFDETVAGISTASWAPGLYLMVVSRGSERQTIKLVK